MLNGCEGTESILLLSAAVLAFAAPWRRRLAGLAFGMLFIFLLNQVRIAVLFYSLRHMPGYFEPLHGYVAPSFIVVAGTLFFLAWSRWALRDEGHGPMA